eukprot:7899848-Lingulodinium_polyedra.AAC.1
MAATLIDNDIRPLQANLWELPHGEQWAVAGVQVRSFTRAVTQYLCTRLWEKASKFDHGSGLEHGVDWYSTTRLLRRCEKQG